MRDSSKKKWETRKQDARHEEFSKLAAAGRRRLDENVCVCDRVARLWAAAAAVAAAQKRTCCSRVTAALNRVYADGGLEGAVRAQSWV